MLLSHKCSSIAQRLHLPHLGLSMIWSDQISYKLTVLAVIWTSLVLSFIILITNLSFRGLKWYNRKVCPRAEKLHCYRCSLQQILGTWIDPHWNNVRWEMPYKSVQFVESHGEFQPEKRQINISSAFNVEHIFSKFYGKVGVISWLLFHLIWKIMFYTEILTQKVELWLFSHVK